MQTEKAVAQGAVVAQAGRGVKVRRYFTAPGVDPAEELVWELRTATITGEDGGTVFEQRDVEVPRGWSMLATNVVASKYFRGAPGTPERESSVRQLVGRVVSTLGAWGQRGGYFAEEADAQAFQAELTHLLLRQKMSFNSPVWFNLGVEAEPQCSACFINSVEDSMESILGLARTEGMLFKFGSGTGTNLSPVRSSREALKGGGTASGPVSFMKGFDAFAGVIKSGGKTRRAAKMVILDAGHPDILEFIDAKVKEEKKAWALIDAGYDGSFNGEAYGSVFFQNSNNSVRVSDEFMRAVVEDRPWVTRAVTDGRPVDVLQARAVFQRIAEAAWQCGDPGLQFDTTINGWHTCLRSGRINASNPCSEYMFLDDSACNLASLNLMQFRGIDGVFDVAAFEQAVDVTLLAMEIIVGGSRYPTERIARNSHRYRPLGLGYANLGALLMAQGLPYDSDEGRLLAGAITSLLSGRAYATSARLAESQGAFEGHAPNREAMLKVVERHRTEARKLGQVPGQTELSLAHLRAWDEAVAQGALHGFRNSQVTVLAPTGTIGFMMDCDTTGVEPDIALVKFKKLVGGGTLKLVNGTVPLALQQLGYAPAAVEAILKHLEATGTIEGAPALKAEHLPVFDCAFTPAKGTRSIAVGGHLRMMAAAQPFLSGAISKTVNLPATATVEDVSHTYLEAWKLGLKAVALYRDGCKRSQPLSTKPQGEARPVEKMARRRLPDERRAVTHKFSIGGHEGYITVGMYDDGTPGEVFITMAKEGSTVSGLMDSFATAISLSLQYGVPLKVLADKFSHTRYEPSGFTNNKDIPIAKSITDYIFRWLALKFLPAEGQSESMMEAEARTRGAPATPRAGAPAPLPSPPDLLKGSPLQATFLNQSDAPPCPVCGSITVRNGACYKCHNCGTTTGCS